MAEKIVIQGAREHPGTKILRLHNLIADYFTSGFGAGQARL